MSEFIRKITKGTIGIENKPDQSFVAYGKVHRATAAESQYGPFIRFKGFFEAINEQTGEVFTSNSMILPGVFEDALITALDSAHEQEANSSVEFAVRLKTVPVPESVYGYEWRAEPLKEPSEDNVLSRLRNEFKNKLQITAPKKAPAAAE